MTQGNDSDDGLGCLFAKIALVGGIVFVLFAIGQCTAGGYQEEFHDHCMTRAPQALCDDVVERKHDGCHTQATPTRRRHMLFGSKSPDENDYRQCMQEALIDISSEHLTLAERERLGLTSNPR